MLTCPLEVVKTRFQASSSSFERVHHVLNDKKNSIKLSSHLNAKPQSAYSSLNVNLNNLIRNTHLTHHHKNVITNGLNFDTTHLNSNQFQYSLTAKSANASTAASAAAARSHQSRWGSGIYLHMRFIVEHEGYRALFKGLLPNIVGVAPYRYVLALAALSKRPWHLNALV